MKPSLLSFLLLWTAAHWIAGPAATQEVLFLIRHAERDWVAGDALTEAGHERASAWAKVFEDAELDAVVASEKRRTRDTGRPIADHLDVPISVVPRADYDALLHLLLTRHKDDRVLIVGHSSTIPEIMKRMGHTKWENIPSSDYGNLFVVHPSDDKAPSVVRINMD